MKFKTIAEAFNHYRAATIEEIEKRAAEIRGIIETDANADIATLNIELGGLKQAKENALEKRSTQSGQPGSGQQVQGAFNPITSMELRSDPATTAASNDIFASREYRSAFHKFMLDQPLSGDETATMERARQTLAAEKRDTFISTGSNAAAIPTSMINEIFTLAAKEGGILSLVRRFDMPSNVAVPVATPNDMAEWHTEGEEVKPDNVKMDKVTFAGHELMKVFSISAAARAMSISAFESYLQTELFRTMISALQYAAVNGTGKGQPIGLLANGVIDNTVSGAGSYQTFVQALAGLKRGYAMGATWAMNNSTLYNKVAVIVDGNGRPLFNEPREGATNRILGKSVEIDDFLPDGVILLGNFQYYAMNYPQSIMLEVSRDSSFRRGLIDYRAMAVADGKPIINEAFTKLNLNGAKGK